MTWSSSTNSHPAPVSQLHASGVASRGPCCPDLCAKRSSSCSLLQLSLWDPSVRSIFESLMVCTLLPLHLVPPEANWAWSVTMWALLKYLTTTSTGMEGQSRRQQEIRSGVLKWLEAPPEDYIVCKIRTQRQEVTLLLWNLFYSWHCCEIWIFPSSPQTVWGVFSDLTVRSSGWLSPEIPICLFSGSGVTNSTCLSNLKSLQILLSSIQISEDFC